MYYCGIEGDDDDGDDDDDFSGGVYDNDENHLQQLKQIINMKKKHGSEGDSEGVTKR
jgi:hypothetical protein